MYDRCKYTCQQTTKILVKKLYVPRNANRSEKINIKCDISLPHLPGFSEKGRWICRNCRARKRFGGKLKSLSEELREWDFDLPICGTTNVIDNKILATFKKLVSQLIGKK